jgi:protein-disulfide isomerase
MSLSKREDIKIQRLRKKRQQRQAMLFGVGGFSLLVVLLIALPTIINDLRPAGEFVRITPIARPMVEGKSMGDPNAPVVIEVFEDFQCPACKTFAETVEKELVASDYITSGLVYVQFRQFPFIDDGVATRESDQSANASMCALEQGRFWEYHDMLYANQNGENKGAFVDRRLVAFAEALGLDMKQFNDCFEQNTYRSEIESDIEIGRTYGVTGTPSIFVNGAQVTPGYVPTYDELINAIESALAAGG